MLWVFCKGGIEWRNHLFFECNLCKSVWLENLRKCLIADLPYKLDAIIERGVKYWNRKSLQVVLFCLVLSASVYNIWKERNNIRH